MNRNWWQKKWPIKFIHVAFRIVIMTELVIYKALFKNGLLRNLGITLIWLSPMYPSPMADNGYDISDYYGISSDFGTMADFDELIEEAKTKHKSYFRFGGKPYI